MIIRYITYSDCEIDEDDILDYFVNYSEKDKVSATDILEEVQYDGTRYCPMFTSFSCEDEEVEVYDRNELKVLVEKVNKAIAKRRE